MISTQNLFSFLLLRISITSSLYKRQLNKLCNLNINKYCSRRFSNTDSSLHHPLNSVLPAINGIAFSTTTTEKEVKVFCLSDLHIDNPKNLDWIKSPLNCNKDDSVFSVFICPGDLGTDLKIIRSVFKILVDRYDLVSYVPGNHEAWRRYGEDITDNTATEESRKLRMAADSVQKLQQILQCAVECGVYVGPVRITMER
eukprot:gene14633-31138_t